MAFLMGGLFVLAGADSVIHSDNAGIALLTFGIVLFGIASIALWLLISTLFEKYWISNYGVAVKAVVTNLKISAGNVRTVFEYYVTYEYTDKNGSSHTGKFVVPGPVARQWNIGKEITIRYSESRPERSIGLIVGFEGI